jgi:hypothetical protein
METSKSEARQAGSSNSIADESKEMTAMKKN